MFINLDELYREFCIIKLALALYLNYISKQNLSVSDKWCQAVLAEERDLPYVVQLLSFVLCTVYSCVQHLHGASFYKCVLLQEK